jgi:hypothetical protein
VSRLRHKPAMATRAFVLALGVTACRSHADDAQAPPDSAALASPEPALSAEAVGSAASTHPSGNSVGSGPLDMQPPSGRDWTGAYQYEECGGPSALTPGGPAACWQYVIEVARARGDANWRAYIAMDGYMAQDRVAARGEESGSDLRLRFEPKPATPDDPPSTHEAGDLLLTLSAKGGETWIRFEAMRTDSGKREVKLERLRAPAQGPGMSKTMNPDPEGFVCKSDTDCVLHRCNTKHSRCAYPCESDADCAPGTRCGAPACIPVNPTAKRTKKK